MFSLWTNDGRPSEASIKQANEHLLLLNQRVIELEQRIHEQKELLDRREREHNDRLRALCCQKDADIKSVAQELTNTRQRVARLEGVVKERDVQVAFLLHRCSYLDEAASYAPLLDQLSQSLKNAFASPSPKVQTVPPTMQQQQQHQQQQQKQQQFHQHHNGQPLDDGRSTSQQQDNYNHHHSNHDQQQQQQQQQYRNDLNAHHHHVMNAASPTNTAAKKDPGPIRTKAIL